MIHRNTNENQTDTDQDTLKEVIKYCPDDTYPDMMEDCVNEESDDRNQNDFIEENETGVQDKEGEESTETESATSEEVCERLKTGKSTIPNININERNEVK